MIQKADEYNSSALKEKIKLFIVDNMQPVILSESFVNFIKNDTLALEVLRLFASSGKINNKMTSPSSINSSSNYN